jgi:uncharacterized protein YprB with RNaseH-like and TPR domain
MKPPIRKLKKSEVEWLNDNTCRHRHTYLEHYRCFLEEKPVSPMKERIGFLDIETSNLKASFGYIISYCIKEMGGEMYERLITPKEIKTGVFDRELLKQFFTDVSRFDRVCVYWGKDRRHDVPFLRTRALKAGTDFPLYRDICVIDLYDWGKNKLSLHSYKLGVVCQELGIPAKEHPLDGTTWVRAMAGDKDALNYILTHNREDVVCMEPLYTRLEPFMRKTKVTI